MCGGSQPFKSADFQLSERSIIAIAYMTEIDWSRFDAKHELCDIEKNLIREVAVRFVKEGVGSSEDWRLDLGKHRHYVYKLVGKHYLQNISGKFYPTFPALSFLPPDLRSTCVALVESILATLKASYRTFKYKQLTLSDVQSASLALAKPLTAKEVRVGTNFLRDFPHYTSSIDGNADSSVSVIWVTENILDFESLAQAWDAEVKRRFRVPEPMPRTQLIEASENPRKVFVVHGRDERLRDGMFTFLRALHLEPIEWTEAIKLTGKASPHISEILNSVFQQAQAVVVLLTPDDEARLRGDLLKPNDSTEESGLTGQARPNVLFEAGMAFASHENRTVLVEIGRVRPFSDIAGRHVVRMDNSPAKRQELATKLETAGCAVNRDGTDWLTFGDMTPQKNVIPVPTSAVESPRKPDDADRLLLADIISELEDNLDAAKMPRVGDTYRKPSSDVWKNNRNRLKLLEPLRSDLTLAYRQIDIWQSQVDSGVHPNYGSEALNAATSSLVGRLPVIIDSLRKLRDK